MRYWVMVLPLTLAVLVVGGCKPQEIDSPGEAVQGTAATAVTETPEPAAVEQVPSTELAKPEASEPTIVEVRPDTEAVASNDEYELGSTIWFSKEGTSQNYTRAGWRGVEGEFRWAIGEESQLCLKPRSRTGRKLRPMALRAQLQVRPYLGEGRMAAQRLAITVNGVEVYSGEITALEVIDFEIPQEAAFSEETLCITLMHPDAAVPAELIPGNTVQSPLAISVRKLVITSAE